MFRLASFRYAWNGIIYFITNERHAPIHLFAGSLAIILAIVLKLTSWEWIAILICIALVICAEIINSSIEKLTDIVSPEFNESAGKVKDMGAAAVLVSGAIAAIIGLIIFVPKLSHLL
jgi:diacylglycerol kinase (ATP)